jgi:hypothetical protein
MELKIKIPTSISDIKLSDYQRFFKIERDNEDKIFVAQKMVQIFCNVPLLAVTNMRRSDFVSISTQLIKVLSEINNARENRTKLIERFTYEGVEYGFIPNLDNMSWGEYIDLEEGLKDVQTYHNAMAILYRPITLSRKSSYLIAEYVPNKGDIMKDITMDIVCGALVFFYRLGMELLSVTPKYLEGVITRNPKIAQALEKNGVGISTYTALLAEACLKLTMLFPCRSTKPYSS